MIKKFDNIEVSFMEDGYINATKVAKKFSKDVRDWLYSQENINYINELTNCGKYPQLVIVKRGRFGGTWLHPKLAVVFARWLSTKFAVWCDEQIEQIIKTQSQQPFMPRGYPQMLEAARDDWKRVRNELIDLLGTHLNVFDRRRKSQFTNQVYLDLIETTARRLREHFQLTQPNQLTRDYLHQLVQECIVEIEIRLSDALTSGSINSWEEFKNELERIADHVRYMKELQNGRIPLPRYAYPITQNLQVH